MGFYNHPYCRQACADLLWIEAHVRLGMEKSMTTASLWLREGEESEVPGARGRDKSVPIRVQNGAFRHQL